MKKIIFNNNAFTLAEVLITLLIIGVVASLTIPAIIAETEKAETAAQVKKYQSVISQAVMNIKIEYGSILASPLNSNENHSSGWNALKKYLNLTKDCGTATGGTCWANEMYLYLNGQNDRDFNNVGSTGRGITQDGASIYYVAKAYCTYNRSMTNSGPLYNSNCAIISVDVNGYKPPNRLGRDVFGWYIMNNGTVYPMGGLDDIYSGCSPSSSDISVDDNNGAPGYGLGCTAKVIKEGKINY